LRDPTKKKTPRKTGENLNSAIPGRGPLWANSAKEKERRHLFRKSERTDKNPRTG